MDFFTQPEWMAIGLMGLMFVALSWGLDNKKIF